MAWAIGVGLVALALALAYGVRTWREVQLQQLRAGEDDLAEVTDSAELIRRGPVVQAKREREAWRAQRRVAGMSDAEIDDELETRVPVVVL